jgi:hypothetical protein
MFEILAPIIFPDSISDELFLTDIIPEINSGSEVPIPTIKTPTTNEGSLKNLPRVSADWVKNLAAINNASNENIKII